MTMPSTRSKLFNLKNAYTDAPDFQSSWLVASLRLLFWLFFHPTAWRNYIIRIAPDLRPDFWLLELTSSHWQQLRLRRLLVIGYVLWPLLGGVTIGLASWLMGNPPQVIITNTILTVLRMMAVSILIGPPAGVAIMPAFAGLDGLGLGIAGGLMGYMALQTRAQTSPYSVTRQLKVALIAVAISSLAIICAISFALKPGFGLVIGLAFGSAFVLRTGNWLRGVIGFSLVSGICLMIKMDTTQLTAGIMTGILMASCFALPFVITEQLGGPWAGAIAGAVGAAGFQLASHVHQQPQNAFLIITGGLFGIIAGLTLAFWRPIITYVGVAIWNLFLYWMDLQRRSGQRMRLRYHAAFWDEHQFLPWLGLDTHLVRVAERNPGEGQVAIAYLAMRRQYWAAQKAQIELDAHHLERCDDIESIRRAHQTLEIGELQGLASALLRSFKRISRDVDAALQQERNYNQRLALNLVEERLDNLTRELNHSNEQYANRFHPIAVQWWQAVFDYTQNLAEIIERRQEIDSPYVIGVPLNEQQEIFVGRTDIGSRIEQLLLDKRRPPLLLYGQRRMGKTSLLNNLGQLLPSAIVPLYVDLQGAPASASDYAGLLYNIARAMIDAAQKQRNLLLPLLSRAQLNKDPFTNFDEWLDQVERRLGESIALLIFDEFEALDNAIHKGRFDGDDILGLLRHLIQHRLRFKLLLAGSHTLEEYHRWASYLINVQLVQVSYLKEEEARHLVEQPVKDFALRYEPTASQHVLALTRCHPFLVQLLCAEIVAYKNEQNPSMRRFAVLADVEAAVPEALKSGSFFFADIERNQVDDAGRAVLRCMAAQGEGHATTRVLLAQACPVDLDVTLKRLSQRELIELSGDGYRFQVELIRRWFAQAD